MDRVKKIKNFHYVDGDGKAYDFDDVIIIDLGGKEPLEELLQKALELDEEKTN